MFTIRSSRFARQLLSLTLSLLLLGLPLPPVSAQSSEVTGAFRGVVQDAKTRTPIANATVRYINQDTQVAVVSRSNSNGEFSKGNLNPGRYTIEVSAPNYKTSRTQIPLPTMRSTVVIPDPVLLEPEATLPVAGQVTVPNPTSTPPMPNIPVNVGPIIDSIDVTAELNATDARRGGTFTAGEVATLPLGGMTFTRSFDELALLLPGVALPPQTQGSVAGPGVGPGIGSAGQFAVNGLRSRGNNFTVDGSDNNDEDIGVRRQGFFTLVPQSIESIQEYQITTALAPAQYGRNLGAQVNANSKSGGYQTHGNFYGFFNASQLNEPDFFDTTSNGRPFRLQGVSVLDGTFHDVFVNGRARDVSNPAAGQDSLTFGQGGFTLGGTLLPAPALNATATKSAFYFLSFEGQLLNANKERQFAVPTIEERGLNETGASGICIFNAAGDACARTGFPTNVQGDGIFSLFPFPNNPTGIYGRNTFTQILPASAQGNVASIKLEHNFKFREREYSMSGRYNRTSDWRNIPAAGGALFATLRPIVRTDNISYFLNGDVTGPNALRPIANQLRLSYGRTRLRFEEYPDVDHLIPSNKFPNEPFLLNARSLLNFTLPSDRFVDYRLFNDVGTETLLGPLGQVQIAGFSPLGVDVYSFRQNRINNTYQVADTLTLRAGAHSVAFGGDFRRTDLNSELPRNQRSLIAFNSSTAVDIVSGNVLANPTTGNIALRRFVSPSNRAATAAASNVAQTLALGSSLIQLRYYQLNFFGQDEWRVRPNLSLSFGLRYEYNTPPREVNDLIEKTFTDERLSLLPNLQQFLQQRKRIFDPDHNNFAPRVGLAYSRNIFGTNSTAFRVGYGLFYDQALGAVVSQSRNVFPSFLTLNTGSGIGMRSGAAGIYNVFNPADPDVRLGPDNKLCFQTAPSFLAPLRCASGATRPLVVAGTLNQLNPAIPLSTFINSVNAEFPDSFGFTLPAKDFPLPKAHHYSFTIEQQLGTYATLAVAYVGTQGRNLLRLTTPNLGPNLIQPSVFFDLTANAAGDPFTRGYRLNPGQTLRLNPAAPNDRTQLLITGTRPVPGIGTVYRYQTDAESRYDALQVQLRGRYRNALQLQLSYTFAKAIDDVSDVFDLAGASALPQNSAALENERGPASFDVRHRVATSFIYLFPTLTGNVVKRLLLNGFELAGTSQYQTAQPFTINSLFDINADGNYTDRLDTTTGLLLARGNNRKPVQLTIPVSTINSTLPLLALCDTPVTGGTVRALCGKDGAVGRNTFRGADFFIANLALTKHFIINERHRITFRTEAFNISNRINFGIPVRFLEAPAFGEATDTVTPGRRIQFALKYSF